jgi:hypothetical protein
MKLTPVLSPFDFAQGKALPNGKEHEGLKRIDYYFPRSAGSVIVILSGKTSFFVHESCLN